MNNFHPLHLEDLRRSGLSDKTIKQAHIKTVPPNDINRRLGFNIPGLTSCYEIPYDKHFSRFKAFYDDTINEKRPKYIQRKESGNRLYIPPTVGPILNDSSKPLHITEGEKKALKATLEGLPCVGLSGLWGWSNGNKELIPDFDQITLKDRGVYIDPDNDWLQPNKHGDRKNLKQAVYELADRLKQRGARVFIVELPWGAEKGLDDYLCNHSVDEFKSLPINEVFSLSEKVKTATQANYTELIQDIADIDDPIKKELLSKELSKALNVNYRTVKDAVSNLQTKTIHPASENVIILHPSYDVKGNILVLGFRETVVIDDRPVDRNFYILSSNGYALHDSSVIVHDGKNIIFDERERYLLRAEDRWSKGKIKQFIDDPIIPSGLYGEIKSILKQYIECQKEDVYGLITAWIIATYFFLLFNAFPFLFIFGKKQTGKSRLLDLLERHCLNAMKIKGISVAGMADSIDGVKGVFLNDQTESLSDSRNAEILGILADSYTIGGGKRRLVDISNKKRRILEFETYAPKAFASTKEIDPDLKDRCIQIVMLRATRDYPYPEAFLPVWNDVRDKLYRLLLTRWKDAREIYQSTGEGVSHRVRELWRPLETVLRLENVPDAETKAIKAFFLESMQMTQVELSEHELQLFETLLEMLGEKGTDILSASDICSKLKRDSDVSEKALQTWVGNMVKQFSLYDSPAGRNDRKRVYHFSYDHVQDVFNRYNHILPEIGGLGGQVAQSLENSHSANDHLKNEGGTGGNGDHLLTSSTTPENEVVNQKSLIDKDSDHLTTETTNHKQNVRKRFSVKTVEVVK